ncbi:HAD-IC family P-type ATPase [Rhodococcus sp. NBC_00297]|uniref:HAD-IC family P-type ATPase n=1 Tax=Rhodococcus sp. NBC_00297 TaxID=2976005 RepID=UPI002E2D6F13|nr:HAD-IC family P-type ATPase [Rhodococcus sp. NBC_00297]
MLSSDVPTAVGLTTAEAETLASQGRSNDVPARSSRSVADILRGNIFTRINAILAVLLVIVLSTGSIIDAMFGLLIVANSGIGIIQELRAKRTLDALAIVGQSRPIVRRDGRARDLAPHEVVLGDVVELGPGDQIIVDGDVIEADSLDVDESLLTGESDSMTKTPGDSVFSGSFVVAGRGAYRVTKVGREAYAAQLAEEAGKFTLIDSELRSGIDRILRHITRVMVPAGIVIVVNQLVVTGQPLGPALNGMVAALVPMVPEGLVLLTSLAFAVGVVRLGRRQCLVQELPAVEGLARIDVVCADKTGTLTENAMVMSDLLVLSAESDEDVRRDLSAVVADDDRPNASMIAVADALPTAPARTASARAPFSSEKKWSGVSFPDAGNFLIGAPDVLLDPASEASARATELGAAGKRVLLFATSDLPMDHADAPGVVTPRALVVLEQKIRADAGETLNYFADQAVQVKIISGDNAVSVGAVAGSLDALPSGDAVDARSLPSNTDDLADTMERHAVFGRVRPEQKRDMVTALQSRGHTVAMTGDGVNDVLALKKADIGVAMGAGSPAARSVAQIVLLDNAFSTLPHVVAEGRRVIGNIERVSTLFLTKTVYSVVLAVLVGLSGLLSLVVNVDPLPYPFLPRHVTIAAWFTIGIPAFLLSLAPNNERARSGFVPRVLRKAVPAGLVVGVATFATYLATYDGPDASRADRIQSSTSALITLIVVAMWVLGTVARPMQWWKVTLLTVSVAAYAVIFTVPPLARFFELDAGNVSYTVLAFVSAAVGIAVLEAVRPAMRRRAHRTA